MPSSLLGNKKMIITRDLFESIEEDVCQSIHDISEQIVAGDVSISPTKNALQVITKENAHTAAIIQSADLM